MQFGKSCAKPFAVRRITLFDHETQMHHISHLPRRDEHCSQLVTYLNAPTYKRFFLAKFCPLRRQDVEPNVMRVISESTARGLKSSQPIVKHFATRKGEQLMLGKREPFSRSYLALHFQAQVALQKTFDSKDIDLVSDGPSNYA